MKQQPDLNSLIKQLEKRVRKIQKCPKRKYSKKEAREAEDRHNLTMRDKVTAIYQCSDCNFWHLTTMAPGQSDHLTRKREWNQKANRNNPSSVEYYGL